MECPHCHQEIAGKRCSECGGEAPLQARFCIQCGARFQTEEPVVTIDPDDGIDLENRILCPDGNCTGIIIDGKCSECGKPYPGESSKGN